MCLITPNSDTLGPTPQYNLSAAENADAWKERLFIFICSVSSCVTGRLALWPQALHCTDFASMVVSNVKAEGCDNSSRMKVKLILQLEVKDFYYFCTLIYIRLETRPSVGNKHFNAVPSDSSSQKKRSLQDSW